MAGEKTEKATPKKRRDARQKGQVRRSTEANSTFCAFIMFGLLLLIWPTFINNQMAVFSEYLAADSILPLSNSMDSHLVRLTFNRMMLSMVNILLPILGAAMLAGLAINVVQIGFLFTTKPLAPKLNRISPLSGFKRLFSTRTLVELLKSLLKLAAIGVIAYLDFRVMLEQFPAYVGQDLYLSILNIMNAAFITALKMCVAMIFVSLADFLYQHWKHEKDLKMTKQEVKDEYKNMEGDPQIKGKIRAKQRQMSAMRMMSKVPDADVVITNPTHYAVALKYEEKSSKAPVVVAKGQDYIAKKIKEVAIEHGVYIVENKPLAQSLYSLCEIDEEIPADLYQAVADILVFVYKQKGTVRA